MYRFFFILMFLLILTVGCQQNNSSSSNTPKEALEQIHIDEGYAEVVDIYETIEIGDDRVISVYKGIINNSEEIYVANIEQVDGRWLVTDAQNIGMPSDDRLNQSSVTEKFKAGFVDKNSFSNDEIITIDLSNSNFKVWIEVF
ncbi:hypothetical protein [Sporosarcina luteola]|uniref:hypothetical protein n=1 Tax=Sporosarcina luteola TaxID=582850 RepID=UPI002040D9C8|nr:hypothetical protein [Sporosarcina luteola]MCM3711129.1 hypothetical protein [Sporosarcina luteola]